MNFLNATTGVDEVGRGPIAGPVVAAAVILKPSYHLQLKDSKKLSAKQREALVDEIKSQAIDFKIQAIAAKTIDKLNILQATLVAMKKAIESLDYYTSEILIDGNQVPDLVFIASDTNQIKSIQKSFYKPTLAPTIKAVVRGDQSQASIQAAAILAKVYRDDLMRQLDQKYPQYGFKNHKGYPTKAHQLAIEKYGAIRSIHRFSFAPLKNNPNLFIRD